MSMDWDLEKEELTCRSYLENLVDALMMMIYAVPINLRRFEEPSMWNDLPKEANAPSLLHNKHQPYQIRCVKKEDQMLQKNNKMKS